MRMIPMTLDDIVRITFSVFRYLTIAPRPHSLSRLTNSFLHWRLLRSTLFIPFSSFSVQRAFFSPLWFWPRLPGFSLMGGGSFAYVPAEYQRPQPSIIKRSIVSILVSYVYVMRKCISFYKVLFLLDGWENEMTHPAQKKLWTGRLWSIRTLMSLMGKRIMILELASFIFFGYLFTGLLMFWSPFLMFILFSLYIPPL